MGRAIDSSVLVRYFTQDNKKLLDKAKKLLSSAPPGSLILDRVIIFYRQIWKGVNVERWAIPAQEMKYEKPGQTILKHFTRGYVCMKNSSHGDKQALKRLITLLE